MHGSLHSSTQESTILFNYYTWRLMVKSLATTTANEYFVATHFRTIIAWPVFAYSAKKPLTSEIAISNLTEHAWHCIELRLILRHFNFSFSLAVLCVQWESAAPLINRGVGRQAVLDGSRSGCINVPRCERSAAEHHRRWYHRHWMIAVLLYGQLIGTCRCTSTKMKSETCC